MSKLLTALTVTLSLIATPTLLHAGGGGGGGAGGGNKPPKPLTVRYVGVITAMVPTEDGVWLTVGTSYYAVGTALVTPDTNIKLDGGSNASVFDLQIGDTAQIDLLWPSREATKIEAVSAP